MPAKKKQRALASRPNGAEEAAPAPAAPPSKLATVSSWFPLTSSPLPSLVNDPALCPAALLATENELARDPDSLLRWSTHLAAVQESILREQLDARTEAGEDPEVEALLGPRLAPEVGRRSLRRIVDVYERALTHFPRSYKLWAAYLNARSPYVLGTPARPFNPAASKKRKAPEAAGTEMWEFLRADPEAMDDAERDTDQGPWTGALDPVVGIDEWRALAAAYERAVMYLPTMPRIWLNYLNIFLHPDCPPALAHGHARRTFDRALRTLPSSIHERVWRLYLRWAERDGSVSESMRKVWRRFLRVDPVPVEYYVNLLIESEDGPLEAAKLLLRCSRAAAKGSYKSPDGQSPYQLLIQWLEVAERFPDEVGLDLDDVPAAAPAPAAAPVASSSKEQAAPVASASSLVRVGAASKSKANGAATAADELLDPSVDPTNLDRLDVEAIVRADGLEVYKDQAGRLWTGLATYWIKKGEFDHARKIFEEGLTSVLTIRDFTQVFDAYAEFSEQYISELMNALATPADERDEDDEPVDEAELDARMVDFEALMDRRPFLVNEVLIRRNPHDVQEWEKRIALYGADDEKVDETYQEAIKTINPRKATTGLHRLFVAYARFFEDGGAAANPDDRAEPDLASARKVFEKAVTVPFRRVDELAEVWCEWAELEVRNEFYDEAILVMQRATHVPRKVNISYHDETLSSQARLFKSLKLWSFYVDLQESIGTVESTRRAYDRMFELKIANAQIVINYANFLEDNDYFEDSFRVYERGVDLFTYPIAFELWNTYLIKFTKRYGGEKLERARDLFEQALDKCPPKYAKPIYLLYGQFEEDYGLTKRAMSVYDRMTRAVEVDDQFEAYAILAAKTTANYGLPATRAVYERAIEVLPNGPTAEMCLRFAALERKLGEIDRARAIYAHASQFCDPRSRPEFWAEWNTFELDHGSEDTFREYLRVKRAVQAMYNTEAAYIRTAAARPGAAAEARAAAAKGKGDAMADLEADAAREAGPPTGFVAAKQQTGLRRLEDEDGAPEAAPAPAAPTNADEIDIDVE